MTKEELFGLIKKTADLEVTIAEAELGLVDAYILNQADDDIEQVRTEYLKKCVDIVHSLYEQNIEKLKNSKLDIPQDDEYAERPMLEYLIQSLETLKEKYRCNCFLSELVYHLLDALKEYKYEDVEICDTEFYDMVTGWFNE